jgi:hypothetical protein
LTVQLLFYENAVPVSSGRHAGCSVELSDHGFCRKVNSVPLTAVEFRSAAGEYPIVFVLGAGGVQPAVALGLRSGETLFVNEVGEWRGRYVPAFVRRYPFVFSMGPDDDRRFVLCVDEAFEGFNREGRGAPLFTPEGQPSPYVDKVLRFLQEYRAQFLRTRAFCSRLQELDLLEPMQARVGLGGRKLSLGGFSVVNRDRLQAVPGEQLARLVGADELELVYLHLQSLRNFETLRNRLPALPDPEGDPPSASLRHPGAGEHVTIH